jgi:hypothetical protein
MAHSIPVQGVNFLASRHASGSEALIYLVSVFADQCRENGHENDPEIQAKGPIL